MLRLATIRNRATSVAQLAVNCFAAFARRHPAYPGSSRMWTHVTKFCNNSRDGQNRPFQLFVPCNFRSKSPLNNMRTSFGCNLLREKLNWIKLINRKSYEELVKEMVIINAYIPRDTKSVEYELADLLQICKKQKYIITWGVHEMIGKWANSDWQF